MPDASKMNISVNPTNQPLTPTRPPRQNWVRLEQVLKWIDTLGYGDRVISELKKTVSKYPDGTYQNFQKNLARHVAAIQEKINKENQEKTE